MNQVKSYMQLASAGSPELSPSPLVISMQLAPTASPECKHRFPRVVPLTLDDLALAHRCHAPTAVRS